MEENTRYYFNAKVELPVMVGENQTGNGNQQPDEPQDIILPEYNMQDKYKHFFKGMYRIISIKPEEWRSSDYLSFSDLYVHDFYANCPSDTIPMLGGGKVNGLVLNGKYGSFYYRGITSAETIDGFSSIIVEDPNECEIKINNSLQELCRLELRAKNLCGVLISEFPQKLRCLILMDNENPSFTESVFDTIINNTTLLGVICELSILTDPFASVRLRDWKSTFIPKILNGILGTIETKRDTTERLIDFSYCKSVYIDENDVRTDAAYHTAKQLSEIHTPKIDGTDVGCWEVRLPYGITLREGREV